MAPGWLVVLKVLPVTFANTPTALERFRREARAAGKLRHEHVVRLLAFGRADGIQFIAMDFVAGQSIHSLLANAPAAEIKLSIPNVLRWGIELSGALQAAHDQGIVHRDVKPGKVVIDAKDRALLLDFGLAKERDSVGVKSYEQERRLVPIPTQE
jgi:serine/threonine protein kinase